MFSDRKMSSAQWHCGFDCFELFPYVFYVLFFSVSSSSSKSSIQHSAQRRIGHFHIWNLAMKLLRVEYEKPHKMSVNNHVLFVTFIWGWWMGHKHNKLMFPISDAFAAFGLASFVVVASEKMREREKCEKIPSCDIWFFFIWNGSKLERVSVVIKFYEKDDISEL